MPAPFYRNDGPWGSGKGSRLTSLEVDQTIFSLKQAIDDAVASIPGNTGIENITYDAASITFELTNDTEFVVPLPVATFNPVGAWANDAHYFPLDLVLTDIGLVLVLIEHETPSAPETFDPAAEVTEGLLYTVIVPYQNIDGLLRDRGDFAGGTEYSEFNVFLSEEFGFFKVLQDHTSDSEFDPHAENTDGPLYRQLAGPPRSPVKTVTADTYTLIRNDANHYLRFTNAAGCVITVPNGDDVVFDQGDEIHIRCATDAAVSVIGADTEVVIEGIDGFSDAGAFRGAVMTLKNVAENEWDLFGLLAPESI